MSKSPIPGALLCFAGMVLLLFASISVPTWSEISFLNVGANGTNQLKYGAFGFTGSSTSIGYFFTLSSLNSSTLHNLTKVLILHPIACGIAGFAFLFGLIGTFTRFGIGIMAFLAALAWITTFVVWIIDMILFGIARQHYRNAGEVAQYGNANWLTLGALVALLLGFCSTSCSFFGRYSRRKGDIV